MIREEILKDDESIIQLIANKRNQSNKNVIKKAKSKSHKK